MIKDGLFKITRRGFLKITGSGSALLVFSNPLKILSNIFTSNVIARNDLDIAPDISNATGYNFKILDFAQVSDIHIVDEGNQLRAEELKVNPLRSIYLGQLLDKKISTVSREQDTWTCVGWDSTIRSINKEHEGKPMAFVMATGDHTDTDLENELKWCIEIADGELGGYRENYDLEPVDPKGLDLPWYVALGNHDVIYEGSIANYIVAPLIEHLSCSAEDLSYQDETIEIYKRSYPTPWWPEDAEDGYYSFDPSPYIHCIVLNTANYDADDGDLIDRAGDLSKGTLNRAQFEWMKSEIEDNPDKLCLIFSHHGPRSFRPFNEFQRRFGKNIPPEEFRDILASYENVIAHINGHTHENHIEAVEDGNGSGYWDINTCSIIDWPQEWRRIAIWDNGDGTGIIKCRMLQHEDGECLDVAYNDPDANHETREGRPEDRDVELDFAIPGEVAENIIANPPEDGLAEGEDDTGSNKTPLFDGGSDDKCFIATAAFGSAMEPEVITLREFRDTMLKPHAMGRLFVNGYYWMSPPIAAFIASRPGMKAIVRYLFRPLIHIIKSHYLGR